MYVYVYVYVCVCIYTHSHIHIIYIHTIYTYIYTKYLKKNHRRQKGPHPLLSWRRDRGLRGVCSLSASELSVAHLRARESSPWNTAPKKIKKRKKKKKKTVPYQSPTRVRALWHAFVYMLGRKIKIKIISNKYVSIWRSIVNGSHMLLLFLFSVSDAIKGLEK